MRGRARSSVFRRMRPRPVPLAVIISSSLVLCTISAGGVPAAQAGGPTVPVPTMHGYAAGPKQVVGSAAGRAHYVPASATVARPGVGDVKGHAAPVPDLAPPTVGTRVPVTVGAVRMPAGHEVTHHEVAANPSAPGSSGSGSSPSAPSPSASPTPARSGSPSPSPASTPSASPAPSSPATGITAALVSAGGTDNASYSVASTFDTVPMADQSGRIAVTLFNNGTSTWSTDYALGTQVFPASDTTGTGTPLTTGPNVAIASATGPFGSVTVESITPPENPGSYTICWDMVNAGGVYFSAEGAAEYCAAYTIAQYPATVNEQEPLAGTDVDTQTPQLTASAVVPGGYPASPQFSFAFAILSGPDLKTATETLSSGWVAGNGNSWTPKALAWGGTYYWSVVVTDGSTSSGPPGLSAGAWTTPITFVVGNAQPAVAHRLGNTYQADDGNPVMTSDLGSTDFDGSGKMVDPKTANVAEKVTDASVAAAGPPLSVTRTYNSLDPRTSQALGAGWSSVLDMSLDPDPDGSGALILTLADGQQVRFAKNAAGGYAPPQDMYAVVSALGGGGFAVTDQSDTTYSFGQASGADWQLSQITDASGRAETFAYSAGAVSAITSTTSGRALHLTWSAPGGAAYPHVAAVSTDPVTAGQPDTALTWTYGYTGDLLTAVCPPGTTTACTKYSYITNGSHAPASVLNAAPTAYYRLDDPANATTAANQVPVNDLTTIDPPAGEFSTTPGVAGPVPGVTATGFNGTSSFIPLDGVWCTTPGQVSSCVKSGDTGRVLGGSSTSLAISIWFRTTTASGVLLGLPGGIPGSTAISYGGQNVNLLQIASNGDLQGYGTCSALAGCTWMSSAAPVTDGAWHQAVLIPGQALYLDGKQAATYTGSSQALPAAAVLLGTGQTPARQWSYFNGSMADLSIYQNQLPTTGTVAAQYAAETTPAAELSSVTSPGGRTEMSATYDTVNDRVRTLTDAHGGAWTYGLPASGPSSAAYDNSVLGAGPQDFWPLNDTTGPMAQDLIGSSPTTASPRPPATYTNVTLGVPGPTGFADGTAASFSGSGSQISIPGSYFAGTGSETVDFWFQAPALSAGGTETLFSASGSTGGEPPLIWIDATGCLNVQADGVHVQDTCGIDDGKWHQVVVSVGPDTTSSGSTVQTVSTYVDGQASNGFRVLNAPGPSPAGYVAYAGNGPDGDLIGSIADLSLYTATLTSTQVSQQYQALQQTKSLSVTNGFGQTTSITLPTVNTQTITIGDPVGKNAEYQYADGNLVRTIGALGGNTWYGYDAADRATTITDPDGDTTYVTHDSHNNVTSTTTCAAVNNCQTSYTSYYENVSNPLDPRNDKPTDDRDPRSQSSSDPDYDTVTSYTASGLIAATRTPPTAACPSGCVTTHTYTTGTEAAAGGGTEPAGLLASVATPGGGTATYAYDAAGDLITAADPLGMNTKYAYDNLGRELTATQISDTYPTGLTTSYTYDSLGRTLTTTYPAVTDRVTGAIHTQVITSTYDPDDLILTHTISDTTGGDPSRTTTDTYDQHGNLASSKDPLGSTTTFTYDAFGDTASQTDPAGRTLTYSYDPLGHLLTTTLDGYTGNPSSPQPPVNLVEESRAYDPAGRLASVTAVNGTQTSYTYYGNNKLASSYIPDPDSSTGQSDVTTYTYDPDGNITGETKPGGLVVTDTVNAANQVVSSTADPAGADLTTSTTYNPDGNITASSIADGGAAETATATYNAMDELMSSTVADGNTNLTTRYTRDQRGLVTSVTDPAGNTTYYQNDEAERPVVETLPPVQSQNGTGGAAVTANPVYTTGYDAFGDITESSDADGNITTAAYDQDGRQTSVTAPPYTPPGATSPVAATTTMTWNSIGQETSVTDPLGGKTQMGYDQLGDLTSQTDADGGTWTNTYDPAGEQTSVTDPTGAQTQATYDGRGRRITTTQLVRQNTSAAYTTTYGYDDAGNQTSLTSPAGVTATAAYNALGEMTSSTDGAGNTARYAYNLNGQEAKVTLPDGSGASATYDQAGRMTAVSQLGSAGTVLRTATAGYDPDGNMTSSTDFRGTTTTAAYDPTGELTALTQPVTAAKGIQLSYGYDLNGNPTQQLSGNGNTTWTTYNSRGLPQAITEPQAGRYTSAADTTTTNAYDADGNLTQQTLPGGVQITSSYDPMGRLLTESGNGATAATASRTYTYDTAGRILSAATAAAGTQGSPGYQPATSDTFGYDDRGLLLAAAGSAGTSSFGYNASAQLTSDTGPSGTSTYTYNAAGLLATDTDAASGTTGTYSYNNLGQVTSISYGTGNDTRAFTYDPLHRLASSTLSTAAGTQVAAISYGYDTDNDITSMTTSGLATAGGGTGTVTNTYGYDLGGRLTSWTAAPASGTAATTSYGYDNDGNLTSSGTTTYSYDSRDQLTSDSKGNTYSYAADGDLIAQIAPGGAVTSYTSDAYAQQITDAGASYTWDALNRVTSATAGTISIALTYSGATGQLTSDGTATYSRDPGGALVGINSTAVGSTLALSNQHDDLVGTFTRAGAALASSTTYDPWGQVIAAAGPAVQIGYQGQWTDPATGQVNMGSRFYSPARGNFLNYDTTPAGNPYAYAGDNPVTVTDITGHSPDQDSSSAGHITQADLDRARSAAADAEQKAASLEKQAAQARNTEARDLSALNAAASYARQMNTKAGQAQQAYTEAEVQAQEAFWKVQDDLTTDGFSSIAALQAKVNALQDQLQADEQKLYDYENPVQLVNCVYPAGGPHVCEHGPPSNSTAQAAVLFVLQASVEADEMFLGTYQAELTQAQNDNAASQKATSKAHSLWVKYQDAVSAASRADQAASLAQDAYNQAVATASRLTQQAGQAEQAAQNAENEYQKLKDEYDKQQAKGKPKKHPGHPGPGPEPCSTTCVHPNPRPQPIRPPEPPSNGPSPGHNPGPSQSSSPGQNPPAPSQSPDPSTGNAGQGSGNGGSGQPPAPSCSSEGDGSTAQDASPSDLFANGKVPSASELELFGISQGWTASQTPSGPLKFIDQNGITRMTLKSGSPRAPGSGSPHAEFRDPTGQRIDPFGNPVQRRSPGNHTPIEWDC